LNFLNRFSKNAQIPNFIEIRPEGAEFVHAEQRRTDLMKLKVAVRNFANAHKNITFMQDLTFGRYATEQATFPTISI
jgi:hypothetical protein